MPSRAPRHLPALAAAALWSAALGCSEPAHPPYTRLAGGKVPGVDRAGAVLVVFWATWCPPCREELPGLLGLARDPPARLEIVTFGEDQDEAPVRDFFGGPPPRELGYRRDVGRVAEALGVTELPAAFLVVDGQLVARFAGPRDWGSRGMRRLLVRLASEPPGPGPARPGVDPPRRPR